MDIEEIRRYKADLARSLAQEIGSQIAAFHNDTGMPVVDIQIEIQSMSSNMGERFSIVGKIDVGLGKI